MQDSHFIQPLKIDLNEQEDEQKNKRKPPLSCCKNTTLYFCNFCDNTSIHGFKFFGERQRNIFERIFWFVVIAAAIGAAGGLIYNTYMTWITLPILITFATTETPIWHIPFPSVTICPEIHADSLFFNYSDVFLKYKNNENTTDDEDRYFNMYSLLCNENLNFINEIETKYLSDEELLDLVTAFGSMGLQNCKWLGNEIFCGDLLSHHTTSHGWCRTFNMLSYDDIYKDTNKIHKNKTKNGAQLEAWSLEGGYPSNAGLKTFPRRTMVSGINGGFQIDFNVYENDLDYLCTDLQGYKVALHHPAEIPNMDKYFRVPLNQVVVAGISPRMITTSDEIKSYSPEDRQCYVPGEKTLKLFKIYSQQNCLFECLANFTLVQCNCTAFYVSDGNLNCGAGSRRCMDKAKIEFMEREASFQVKKDGKKIKDQCGCLPACTSIEFDSETSQIDWDWRKIYKLKYDYTEPDTLYGKTHKSRLLVYYKDLQFMTSVRHELYGTIEFLANCGGLLGLCCGFSFTSLMEIIYYLTLRLVSNLKKFGWKFWSGCDKDDAK